jgi:hypothetical protein
MKSLRGISYRYCVGDLVSRGHGAFKSWYLRALGQIIGSKYRYHRFDVRLGDFLTTVGDAQIAHDPTSRSQGYWGILDPSEVPARKDQIAKLIDAEEVRIAPAFVGKAGGHSC